MARQDKDSFFDPALVAAWRRMLWVMRGSADVLEALAPSAAGMTKDEISRLLARAGAPSGKGVEPVEQVLGLLGVVPRARYDTLVQEHEALLKQYEELGVRVEEAERSIEGVRRLLRDQTPVDETEQLLDSWGGLVRRTLRAQAGFMRSIANVGGPVAPADDTPQPQATESGGAEQRDAATNGAPSGSRPDTHPPGGDVPQPMQAEQWERDAAPTQAPPTRPATRRRATKASGAGRKAASPAQDAPQAGQTVRPPKGAAAADKAPARPATRRQATKTGGTRSAARSKRSRPPG